MFRMLSLLQAFRILYFPEKLIGMCLLCKQVSVVVGGGEALPELVH